MNSNLSVCQHETNSTAGEYRNRRVTADIELSRDTVVKVESESGRLFHNRDDRR